MKLSPLSFSTGSSFSHADGIDDGVELRQSPFAGGAMLPVFLNDLSRNGDSGSGSSWERELVEVTLELDGDDSIVVCEMSEAAEVASVDSRPRSVDVAARLSRNLSTASSRIRQKLGKLLRSESWKTTTSSSIAGERDLERQTAESGIMTARDKRKENAKLQRSTSSAQRALKGLQFINKTTRGNSCDCDWNCDCDQMWKKVEKRFVSLSKEGLLAREDFGECVGKLIFFFLSPVGKLIKSIHTYKHILQTLFLKNLKFKKTKGWWIRRISR